MAYTLRNVVQRPLTYAELDENFQTVDDQYTEALQAQDAATLNAGIYASTAAGLAATTNGEYFSVPSAGTDVYLELYKNNAGSAVLTKTYYSRPQAAMEEIGSYSALNAYSGSASVFYVKESLWAAGVFRRDDTDTTASDNGGTILVDAAGRRWKREFIGPVFAEWFGADKTGGADSFAAMQAAVNAAVSLGVPLCAIGEFRVTGEIVVSGPLTLDGGRRGHLRDDAYPQEIKGSRIIYDHADATKGAIVLSGTAAEESANTVIKNIEFKAGRQLAQQPALRITKSFHYLSVEEVQFSDVCGPAVQFVGDVYGQNVAIRNTSFNRCGGMIGHAGTDADGLSITLLRLDNINLDHRINATSPQAHLLDLRRCREVVGHNVLLEGAGAAGVTSCIALAADAWHDFTGVHLEWISNAPTYSFYINDTGGHDAGNANYLSVHGLYAELPMRVDTTDSVAIRVTGWQYYYATALSSLISEVAGACYTADIEVMSAEQITVPASAFGRVRIDNKSLYGTEDLREVFGGFQQELFSYRGGALTAQADSGKNAPFQHAFFQSNNQYVVLDADQGRVLRVDGWSAPNIPVLRLYGSLPASYEGCFITALVKYKIVTASAAFGFRVLVPSSGVSRFTVIGESDIGGGWALARLVGRVSDPANILLATSVGAGPSPTETVSVLLAGISVKIGVDTGDINGTVAANTRIETWSAAAPTLGDHIAGDKAWNTAPAAGGAPGWVCVTAGTPGTWKAMASLAA